MLFKVFQIQRICYFYRILWMSQNFLDLNPMFLCILGENIKNYLERRAVSAYVMVCSKVIGKRAEVKYLTPILLKSREI